MIEVVSGSGKRRRDHAEMTDLLIFELGSVPLFIFFSLAISGGLTQRGLNCPK